VGDFMAKRPCLPGEAWLPAEEAKEVFLAARVVTDEESSAKNGGVDYD
jgi:hypothetical protein